MAVGYSFFHEFACYRRRKGEPATQAAAGCWMSLGFKRGIRPAIEHSRFAGSNATQSAGTVAERPDPSRKGSIAARV